MRSKEWWKSKKKRIQKKYILSKHDAYVSPKELRDGYHEWIREHKNPINIKRRWIY